MKGQFLMKIKVFTHTDLDGVGSAILLKRYYGKQNVDCEFCEYDGFESNIGKFIDSGRYVNYEYVYICDMSFGEDIAEIIDSTENLKVRMCLVDHHQTAVYLNKYEWAAVREYKKDGSRHCALSLLHEILMGGKADSLDKMKISTPGVKSFVEIVRRYDTWEWWAKYEDEEPKMWDDLLYIYGKKMFMDIVLKRLEVFGHLLITKNEELLLIMEERKRQEYIDRKNSLLKTVQIDSYNVGVVFAERYISELGNELCKLNPDIDFVAMINMDGYVSYRTIRDDINLGKLAEKFGGGGHAKASGSQIKDDIVSKLLQSLFQNV